MPLVDHLGSSGKAYEDGVEGPLRLPPRFPATWRFSFTVRSGEGAGPRAPGRDPRWTLLVTGSR